MIANKKYLVIERLVTLKRIYSYIQKKFLHLMKKKEEEEKNKSSIRKTMHTVDATRIWERREHKSYSLFNKSKDHFDHRYLHDSMMNVERVVLIMIDKWFDWTLKRRKRMFVLEKILMCLMERRDNHWLDDWDLYSTMFVVDDWGWFSDCLFSKLCSVDHPFLITVQIDRKSLGNNRV